MKTILITGASKGIGLATSFKLAKAGHKVLGIARHQPENYPGDFFKCDLSDVTATAKVLEKINDQYSTIEGVVNNVGIVKPEPLERVSLNILHEVYDLNVRVAVQVIQAFVCAMKKKRFGRIINISSRAVQGSKGLSSYTAAKSALIGLTRTWALELAPFNITVNAIAPGFIETTLLTFPAGATRDDAIKCTPLGRIGKPDEIAATIEFLLSEDSGFMTGQTLYVDGGRSL
jgi:3-oxoacyl-[acyl-carrier protein] reductase